MRRVWVFTLIAVLAVSAIVAGSAGYLYLHDDGEVEEESLRSETTWQGREVNDTSEEGEGNYPTEQRYVNVYEPDESPEWIPESEFSMENHTAGTYEVTRYPNAEPTEEQLNAAWKLYNESFEAAKENRYFEFDRAVEDGYKQLDTWHYINISYYFNDDDLNTNNPESLVYHPETKQLLGYMYLTDSIQSEGKQIGGPLTIWHYHPAEKKDKNNLMSLIPEDFDLESADDIHNGELVGNRSPEMIHVWLVKHPNGPFATDMTVGEEATTESEKMTRQEFEDWLNETELK